MSHQGTYTCEKRDETRTSTMTFGVLVSTAECPDPAENIAINVGVSKGLPCKQEEILRLNDTRIIRWMKDCQPLQGPVSVSHDGYMRLSVPSERHSGIYTCLIDITLDGRKYTAARSIQLDMNIDPPVDFPEIHLLSPQQEEIFVQVGMRAELQISANVGHVGFDEDEILIYWTIDGDHTDNYEELSVNVSCLPQRGRVVCKSTLFISRVLRSFLNVPIHFYVQSPVEEKTGLVMLREADYSGFYRNVALCLTTSMVVIVLAATVFLFKVDLVLSYRKLMTHFFKKKVSDGKHYDAFVSFVQSQTTSASEKTSFALQRLSEELEQQQGYSLYIRGRDDCPGQAMHDDVSAKVRQCRRLIIILSLGDKEKYTQSSCAKQNQLLYEQKVGLHDALIQNDPKIILVETDGPVDYSCLPESLRYIKRKQGALKWNLVFDRKEKVTILYSNRRFWKNLRYYMPSVPARRAKTVV
ncbi:interleukin-1 receptor type 1 [Cololabis saira]|uniref:interleukin-1 receptor type 1 n=1 Tax=Cololabis saira TaxID=129043 RepID=UPI002AD3BDAB|nr:interleukin-1 receptor type 1 [Cololabis saira]